jgi:pyruvate formate lyase activating enzyme
MKEALFYEKNGADHLQCRLCPKMCQIKEGGTGFCRVRQHKKGVLYTTNYGKYAAANLDPVEKKPLYHFCPGTYVFSLGTKGCNLKCSFCQNWCIAHGDPCLHHLKPSAAVKKALDYKEKGYKCIGLAYTYSEPAVWYEYVYDTARLARQAGLKNVLVTNGFINEEPLKQLLPYIDALNIDLKSFNDEYYLKECKGHLAPVLRTIEVSSRQSHLEITTLLLPGLNDSPDEINQLAAWIAHLNKKIPLHFSRYFPSFEKNLPATPLDSLRSAHKIAREKLDYVYIGNAPQITTGSNTDCPQCGQTVIQRSGYAVKIVALKENKCLYCGYPISITC